MDVAALEGMGDRSGQKVVAAINKTMTMKLDTFLAALGISSLGRGNSERLVNYVQALHPEYDGYETLDFIEIMASDDLALIEGFADIMDGLVIHSLDSTPVTLEIIAGAGLVINGEIIDAGSVIHIRCCRGRSSSFRFF